MAEITNISELQTQLKKAGTLSEVLLPEHFAGLEAVAATIAQLKDIKELKPTQTRRIFTTIKQLEQANKGRVANTPLDPDSRMRLRMLEPELAYAVGRKLIPLEFYEVLKLCLRDDKMKTVGDLRRLVQFLSAVIAYQKFYSRGG